MAKRSGAILRPAHLEARVDGGEAHSVAVPSEQGERLNHEGHEAFEEGNG